MARIRSIKPGLFANEQLGVLPGDVTVLFAGLWCLADRDGRLEDRPQRIKRELFRYREVDIEDLLDKLEGAGFIKRYSVKTLRCIQVINFKKHQRPNKNEADSDLPPEGSRTTRRRSKTNTQPIKNGRTTDQEPTHDARIKSKERGEKEHEGEKEGVQGEVAETASPSVAPKRARRASATKPKKPPETVEEMIARHSANPTYAGIDVRREYGKMCAWCEVKHRQPTPGTFVNWLNKIDSPLPRSNGRDAGKSRTPEPPAEPAEEEQVHWTTEEYIAFVNKHEKEQEQADLRAPEPK